MLGAPFEILQRGLRIKSMKKAEAGQPGAKGEAGPGQPGPGVDPKGPRDLSPGPQGREGCLGQVRQGPGPGEAPGAGGPGLTSMRKSPMRNPARHATPPSSTDSRYCRAGKAGVGVNSSMGVCAADGRSRRGRRGGEGVERPSRGWGSDPSHPGVGVGVVGGLGSLPLAAPQPLPAGRHSPLAPRSTNPNPSLSFF